MECADPRVCGGDGEVRAFLPVVGEDCDLHCVLVEHPCLDMVCRFFFTRSRFAEPDHLHLLVLHLPLHSGKHLEELFVVELGLGFRGLHPKWRNSV